MFLVAYLQRTAKDYDEFKGSICFLFLGENLFRTGLYLCTGLLNRSSLCFSLISLAAAFCAARLARLLSPSHQRRAAAKAVHRVFSCWAASASS